MVRRTICDFSFVARRFCAFLLISLAPTSTFEVLAAEPNGGQGAESGIQSIRVEVPLRELNRGFCWFHPRVASIPGQGVNGAPSVIMTIQKHLAADDHYSGLYFLRTNDLGQSWTKPIEIPELAWQTDETGATVSVADVTPAWHPHTGKLIAIGTKVRYSAAGAQLLDLPRSHECAYSVFDPKSNQWSKWKMLEVPGSDSKFFLVCPGCVQWLVRPDGDVLLPIYFRGPTGNDFSTTVLRCRFDGSALTFVEHGDVLEVNGGRGLVEPSLVRFGDRYFLTLRNDARGYVTTGVDGLHFSPLKEWTFDDGKELGSYNTQQHWLGRHDGLYLCYTRRGANNDHIARNRAPLFIGQVDVDKVHVVRATEKELLPERGVMLGNFGAASIAAAESWVTDSEFLVGEQPHARGADGSTFVARVQWKSPNLDLPDPKFPFRIVTLGDSITKGARTGVAPGETFASLLQDRLRGDGLPVEVINIGIGGERTDQALLRLGRDVVARQPLAVTIMYGTNDSYVDIGQTQSRITAEQYRDNLVAMIRRLKQVGITPVLMTEPRWGDAAKPNGAGEHPNIRLEKYLAHCRDVAKAEQVELVDHYSLWSAKGATGFDIGKWTTDQCHPNPAGHVELTNAIYPILKTTVERRVSVR